MNVKTLIMLAALFTPVAVSYATENVAMAGRAPLMDPQRVVRRLTDYPGGIQVVVFLGTECPLAKLYATRLNDFQREFGNRGVAFVGVDANEQDSLADIARFARERELTYPLLKDPDGTVAAALGAIRTPEVVVLDAARQVRYRGRIDDQYVVGVQRSAPQAEELRTALTQLLAGEQVTTTTAPAPGCLIGRREPVNESAPVTYHNQVLRLFQQRCIECHRDGEIGPFVLDDYDEAAGWGPMIAEVVRDRRMPPWHASPEYGNFANNCRLSADEIALVTDWVNDGCPEGNPADTPEPLTFTSGWQLPRTPDQIVPMRTKPFKVPAEGGPEGVPYKHFRVPSEFAEDRWVTAAEVQPGARDVVHHIIVYIEPPDGKHRRDWVMLTAYVPGLRFEPLPPGAARLIPAGSQFVFEMHYTPVGAKREDLSRLGLLFVDADKVTHEAITAEVGDTDFRIPPGAAAHEVLATSEAAKEPFELLSLSPHMHLRGKAFRYELVSPSGEREVLLDVPAYNFNWQTRYVLTKPRTIPPGSKIHARALFDNSADNPANPDPTKTVTWGDQSWDEMMLGYFDLLRPRDANRSAGEKPVETGEDLGGG